MRKPAFCIFLLLTITVQGVSNKNCYILLPFYAPNFEKVGSILLSACPFIRPSVQRNLKLGF